MSHFAKIEDGLVTQVVVAEQDVVNTFDGVWVQTSYNTYGGRHPDNRPLRKNFAGVGYAYDAVRDAFIPPKPYPSWVLNVETCLWSAPVAMPEDSDLYGWDEQSLTWVKPQA